MTLYTAEKGGEKYKIIIGGLNIGGCHKFFHIDKTETSSSLLKCTTGYVSLYLVDPSFHSVKLLK